MTIGPAPMIRMDSMSVRFGTSAPLFHEPDEAIEQVTHVVRSRARFRVALEAERGLVGERDALQAAVEQRHVRDANVGWQRRRIDLEAVVLAGDEHLAGLLVEDRMVGAVMAELHFQRPRAAGEPEELMSETDAEGRG